MSDIEKRPSVQHEERIQAVNYTAERGSKAEASADSDRRATGLEHVGEKYKSVQLEILELQADIAKKEQAFEEGVKKIAAMKDPKIQQLAREVGRAAKMTLDAEVADLEDKIAEKLGEKKDLEKEIFDYRGRAEDYTVTQ